MKPDSCKSCTSPNSTLRRRVLGNGGVQIVYQCDRCGRSASNPLSHTIVSNRDSLPVWDESIAKRYDVDRAMSRDYEHERWLLEHDAYLATAKWRNKRKLVMERCAGLCEGCRCSSAFEVHHLTYEHWQDEFLFELVALCRLCHRRIHGGRT